MYREYKPNHLYQNNITAVSCPDFYFVIQYAELMNQAIPEFLHKHDLYEIFYVTEGAMEFYCVDQIHELKKGDVLFLGKNLDHYMIYNPTNKAEYLVVIFDIEAKNISSIKSVCTSSDTLMECQEITNILRRIDEEKYIIAPRKLYVKELIDQIYKEQTEKKIGWNSAMGTLYYRFFINAIRLLSPQESDIQTPFGYMNVALTATKYIHANYAEDINLENIAAVLNVTPRHINRLFQDMFGVSFARTVNIIRMHYAKGYLINTDKSIEWIANSVGLSSAKALTKLFKEQEGITPSEYRLMNMKI